ncbi:hypothetical protein BCV70DRAFT_202744 [Testicularia cyperi]|uniref:Uncharacterized protein n=1 Tax=Testicularia cyperi TaxID=1882483 RepID=A0A317XJ67_9BASI|nr:hypothetical protein BCV70DRAFT_202744 [Testicularia cyperi]
MAVLPKQSTTLLFFFVPLLACLLVDETAVVGLPTENGGYGWRTTAVTRVVPVMHAC